MRVSALGLPADWSAACDFGFSMGLQSAVDVVRADIERYEQAKFETEDEIVMAAETIRALHSVRRRLEAMRVEKRSTPPH